MGGFFYGPASPPVEMNDRLLAHVKVAMTVKMRRGEELLLTCRCDGPVGGEIAIRLAPDMPVRFFFDGDEPALLQGALLRSLLAAADSTAGMVLPTATTLPALRAAS